MARNKRIELLALLANHSNCLLDVGTDHGLVLFKAFKKGYIKKAIASDLRSGPLNQAKKNLKGFDVTYILSDGFKSINQPFDTAIIAGMGAHLIKEIMMHAPRNKKYILQANDKHHILRAFLNDHGYQITDEFVVFDKFYYVIMVVTDGKMNLDQTDLYLGPILKNKLEAKPYYENKLKIYQDIMSKADLNTKNKLDKIIKIFKKALSKDFT